MRQQSCGRAEFHDRRVRGACNTLDFWCFFNNLPPWALALLVIAAIALGVAIGWSIEPLAAVAGGALAIAVLGAAQTVCHVRTAGRHLPSIG